METSENVHEVTQDLEYDHEYEDEYGEEADDTRPHYLELDNRILWIRDRVMKFLGLSNHEYLFDELVHANRGHYEEKLMKLLIADLYGSNNLEEKLIFFYKTIETATVQEEVTVWEENQRGKTTTSNAFASTSKTNRLTKSAPGKVEEDGRKKDKKRKLKKSKSKIAKEESSLVGSQMEMSTSTLQSSQNFEYSEDEMEEDEDEDYMEGTDSVSTYSKKKILSKSAPSDSITFIPPLEERSKYILTKKIVERVKDMPVLNVIWGEIDSERLNLQDVNFFYFMRSTDDPVPSFDMYEEAMMQMPSYMTVGSINGKFLASLNTLLIQVYKPLVENQFRAPKLGEQYRVEETVTTAPDAPDIRKATSTLASIVDSRSLMFRRPSEYRRVSVGLSKEDEDAEETEDEDEGTVKNVKIVTDGRDRDKSKIFTSELKSDASILWSSVVIDEDSLIDQSKKDMLDHLDKLIASTQWTLEHVEDDILLKIPKIAELDDPLITDEMLMNNKEMIEQLEEIVMSWGKHIQKVLDLYISKEPRENGPIAEYYYWHNRETGLSLLVEQLKIDSIQRILNVLNKVLSSIASAFQHFERELWKYYLEARDNMKFLSTIMRHFKLIAETDSFKKIGNSIPPLTDGLKMIWTLSMYYSKEENMMALFERISWQLCQNIRLNMAVTDIFKPLDEVLRKSEDIYRMLKNWKESYLKTRQEIEDSGKGSRWEFDQKRLFHETEYMATVCKDFNAVAKVLRDFYNIFGDDLKSIIYDPAQIDAIIKRVDALILPIQTADFDVFCSSNKDNWELTMASFNTDIGFLENDAKFFIDECFSVLISAENALDILVKFKNLQTRPAIQKILFGKFDVIMQQFSKEIGVVESIFNRGKRNPPLLLYHPPMAGAIYWARQLFDRLKGPVLRFQNINALKHNELKKITFSQYMEIAKNLKEFEENKFNTWVEKARQTVTNTMNKNILKVEQIERERGTITFPDERKIASKNVQLSYPYKKWKRTDFGSPSLFLGTPQGSVHRTDLIMSKPSLIDTASSIGGATSKDVSIKEHWRSYLKTDTKISLKKDQKVVSMMSLSDKPASKVAKTKWTDFMQDSILVECQLRFQVNFNWKIFEVIHEAELMEQLGFELPQAVRDVGIQKLRLRSDIEATEKMINQYNEIVDKLERPDIQLLRNTLLDVEKHIQPGIMRFNWNSLSIADYASSCRMLLKNLSATVVQINQMKKELDERIESEIQLYNLMCMDREIQINELLPCKTFFLEIEKYRTELICGMYKVYQSIGPMLMKLESLLQGISTGKSSAMRFFYEKYEKQIFGAFIMCMAKNMEHLDKMLSGNKVMFQVDVILIASEVILRPSPNEIYSIILHNVKDLLERLKTFPRWMNGTCLECKPQRKDSSEEYSVISFFEDVMSIQLINDYVIIIQDIANKISLNCWRYVYKWKKYTNLWSYDKKLVCEKFAASNPSLLQYEQKFTFYGGILEELVEMEPFIDINSVRLNLQPLIKGIEQHAIEWQQVLANFLLTQTVQDMNILKEKIEHYQKKVELVITDLDRFTVIVQAISDIKKIAIQTEVEYTSYQETFQILRSHGITFPDVDEDLAYELQNDWESLYLGALYRGSTIISTTEKFSNMTQEQIIFFKKELADFMEDFDDNGPGSVGEDLDLGVEKMGEYGKLIEKLEQKRQKLLKSEILFDLEPEDYSAFLKLQKDYEAMQNIYALYKEQKEARYVWAQTLWVNLNPQQLLEGMEHFIREFRKMPRAFRKLHVGQTLDANMKNFKNSVPLFVELKNEAMRDRHWNDLMKKTGQYFDMNPERCADD